MSEDSTLFQGFKPDLLSDDLIELRALEKDDLEDLYSWENDTEIWHLGNRLTPFSHFTLEKYIISSGQDIYEARQLRLIISLKEGNISLGAIDLFDFDPYNLRAGIGILIAEKKHREKNYASRSLDILIKYAKEALGLKQLYCNILENNQRSLNLFVRKGFVVTGAKKDWVKIQSNWVTEYFLQKKLN